jgi:hypothetical protein
MISLETAQRLKARSLVWRPVLHDFFAIPERGMDDRIFVISDLLANIERLQGALVVSFQGASEWALDSLVLAEAVWLPSESQLREILETLLVEQGRSGLRLSGSLSGYQCEIPTDSGWNQFGSGDASEAYAQAILYMLEKYS